MTENHTADQISRALEGDLKAYGKLVKTHQDSDFNTCFRMLGNRQDAEEHTQDTFLRAYRKMPHCIPDQPYNPLKSTGERQHALSSKAPQS